MNRWFMYIKADNGHIIYFLKYFIITLTRVNRINDSRLTIQFGFSKYYIALQLRKGDSIVKKSQSETKSPIFTA